MKANSLQLMAFQNRWRRVVLLFAFLSLICVTVTSRSAQSKNPRRVTALQVGEAVEGSRVTIVSDSALNDYEAFRRGDRFYVRIPLADFTAAQPSFRSHGFEDVRVEEVGDDVIVSFKLQPGASARVDQHSNRLEVVFSALRGSRTGTAANSYPTTRQRRNTGNSEAVAGPMPPASPPRSTSRFAPTGRTNYPPSPRENSANNSGQAQRSSNSARRNVPESGPDRNNSAQALRSNKSSRRSATETGADPNNSGQALRTNKSTRGSATGTGADPNGGSNSTAENLAPKTKPTFAPPTSSPGTAGPVSPVATPSPFSTPTVFATPNVPQPASAPVSASPRTPEATGWEGRIKFLKAWAKLNQSALMLGGLIALALLIGIVLWSRLKGRPTATGKASKKTPGKPVSEKVAATHGHRDADQEREVFEL